MYVYATVTSQRVLLHRSTAAAAADAATSVVTHRPVLSMMIRSSKCAQQATRYGRRSQRSPAAYELILPAVYLTLQTSKCMQFDARI